MKTQTRMKQTQKKPISIKALESDYLDGADSIFAEDSERLLKVKRAILKLPVPERRVLLLYAELGTYTDTARALKTNVKAVKEWIQRIREKIIEN